MADLSKLKRRSSLGAPPPLEQASQNLTAPETAPIDFVESERAIQPAPSMAAPVKRAQRQKEEAVQIRVDGRTLRKTGRTVNFTTRVTEQFNDQLRRIAQRDGLKFVEVLERALDAYEASEA